MADQRVGEDAPSVADFQIMLQENSPS